jgi:hypothetical protein
MAAQPGRENPFGIDLNRDLNGNLMVEEVHDTDNPALRDYIRQLRNHELAHRRHGQDLLANLVTATNLERYPSLDFSPVVTIVDAAPDEKAQLEAAMVRLARRGEYDPMAAGLAIATVGLQDTDAVADFLDNLAPGKIEYTTAASGKKLVQCVACEEQLPAKDLVLASCGHCYCGSCVSIMFNAAVSDESCYPPRCCANTPIPIEHATRFLEPEFEILFEEKGEEYDTVDRTYCSNPECSIFTFPDDVWRNNAECRSCESSTCVICKAPAHGGDCPADLELPMLLKLAEEMHWQRCHNCLRIVQRQDGCSYME